MPNARQTSVIGSPSKSCATNRRRSSTTEHSFHGIHTSRLKKAKSVTHVSGTNCHLCLRPHKLNFQPAPPKHPPKHGGTNVERSRQPIIRPLRAYGVGPTFEFPD